MSLVQMSMILRDQHGPAAPELYIMVAAMQMRLPLNYMLGRSDG